MTSVLPAWKQELIEKRRRKEREQQTKIQEDTKKVASIPEWKRSILERKRREAQGQSQTTAQTSSSVSGMTVTNNVEVFGPKAATRKASLSNQQGRNTAVDSSKGSINARDGVYNDLKSGHSGVTIDGEAKSTDTHQIQSKHGSGKSTNDLGFENSDSGIQNKDNSIPDSDIKVAYEHVRPPSELRKLFGEKRVKKTVTPTVSVNSNATPTSRNIQTSTRSEQNELSSLNTAPNSREIELNAPSDAVSSSSAAPKLFGDSSRAYTSNYLIRSTTELVSKRNEYTLQSQNDTQFVDSDRNNLKNQHQSLAHDTVTPTDEKGSEYDELKPSSEDAESGIPHVDDLRNKFGPVGKFHLRSSSVENLSTASSDSIEPLVIMRGGSKKRPVLSKRWTADLSTLMSPTQSIDDEDADVVHALDHLQEHPLRQRSTSLHDLGHDGIPNIHFRHRSSISHGIERRVHELLRQASHSEGHTEGDEEEYRDSISIEDDSPFASGVLSPQVTPVEEPTRLRTASWTEPETAAAVKQDNISIETPYMGEKRDIDVPSQQRKVVLVQKEETKSSDIEVTSFKQPEICKPSDIEVTSFKESNTHKPEIESTIVVALQEKTESVNSYYYSHNGEISEEDAAMDDVPCDLQNDDFSDIKPKRGSVHKLSAMFGSSIMKGNRKGKNKEKKTENKMKKEDWKNEIKNIKMDENKKNGDGKTNGPVKKFPWNRNSAKEKSADTKFKKVENSHPSEAAIFGINNLRHVETKQIEHKITGQMTLVIGSDADAYRRNPKRTQYFDNSFLNRNQDSANDNKSSQSGQINSAPKPVQIVTQQDVRKTKSVPVTPVDLPPLVSNGNELITRIDIPGPDTNDVEVSAIDIPEPPRSPAPVSIIDLPPADDVSVSIIDVPEEFQDDNEGNVDEVDSDDSDADFNSGSYDITIGTHPLILSFGERENKESADYSSNEEEEDIDDVPVSYVGDSTYMTVPEVVFDNPPAQKKSCLSSPMVGRKKDKTKVNFPTEALHKVHRYPSEQCFAYHYDLYSKQLGITEPDSDKTLNNYKPSSVENYAETLKMLQQEKESQKDENKTAVNSDPQQNRRAEVTSITYSDEGDGFTSSSSSSGALLF